MGGRQRWGLLVILAVIALSVLVMARAPAPDGFDAATQPGSAAGSSAPSTATSAHAGKHPAKATEHSSPRSGKHAATGRITLAFVGDINFTGPMLARLTANPNTALAPIASALSKPDVTVANLETSITNGGTPAAKEFTFRAPPSALTAVKAAGIDAITVANNHGLDYGPGVVDDALAASKATGMPVIGIGKNEAQAMTPFRVTVRGNRVAVLAATQVIDDNLVTAWTATPDHPGLASAKRVDQLVAAVRAARPTTDTLVVYLHWGKETLTCPITDQQTLAKQLVDAGADIVVGTHAHRVQGAGHMGNTIVDYGLGNFVFTANSAAAATSGIFQVETGGGQPAAYSWQPAVVGSSNLPTLNSGMAATNALQAWNQLRSCTGLAN